MSESRPESGGGSGDVLARSLPCLVAGMAVGADSIDDMDLLRHGAVPALFGGIRAPSTLGWHLRSYTWGHAAQLEKAAQGFLAGLARQAPLLVRGAASLAARAIATARRVGCTGTVIVRMDSAAERAGEPGMLRRPVRDG